MESTTRGLWTLIHGMGFGGLSLLACSGAIVELWRQVTHFREGDDGTKKRGFHTKAPSLERTDCAGTFRRRDMAFVVARENSAQHSEALPSLVDPVQSVSGRRTCRARKRVPQNGWKHDYSSSCHGTGHRHLRTFSQSRHGQHIAHAIGRSDTLFSDQCRVARASRGAWLLGWDSHIR